MFLVVLGLAIYSGQMLYDHQRKKRVLPFVTVFALACVFVGAVFAIISAIFLNGALT